MNNLPANTQKISDIIEEYQKKSENLSMELKRFDDAQETLQYACTIGNTYGGPVNKSYNHIQSLSKNLLISAWKRVYEGLNIDDIASANDKKRFSVDLQNPPEFTVDNIKTTFGKYVLTPRYEILKGLAEVFCNLDPVYKSHKKVAIGVEGLPKRVIINRVYDSSLSFHTVSEYGKDKVQSVFRTLGIYRGIDRTYYQEDEKSYPGNLEIREILGNAIKQKFTDTPYGISVKAFKNGNAHLFFDDEALKDINKALAEFYGDVLPDTDDKPDQKRQSTSLTKDLQFYPTPKRVLKKLEDFLDHRNMAEKKILEPSCGDGRILEWLQEKYKCHSSKIFGVETDFSRVEISRKKGFSVAHTNFLEYEPLNYRKVDCVIMNPPFYGKTWKKHFTHAMKFLKDGGFLIAILPASAYYDGELKEFDVYERWSDFGWHDLPIGSFHESGTNINTGYFIWKGNTRNEKI